MVRHTAPRVVICGEDVDRVREALAAHYEVDVAPATDPGDLSRGAVDGGDVVVWATSAEPPSRYVGERLRECPCPVVVATRKISEDAYLELLRGGALEVVRSTGTEGEHKERLRIAVERARARARPVPVDAEPPLPDRLLGGAADFAELMILVTDANGAIEYVNPYWCAQTGYRAVDAIGKTPRILKSGKMAAGDYERLWTRISGGEVWHGYLVNRRVDGSEFAEQMVIAPIVVDGEIRHYLQIGMDATATVGLADTLERGKRFETLGWAIGGMAHEFNNIFGVVLANAESLSAQPSDLGSAVHTQAMEDVIREVERGRTVVRRLLMYTGRWRIRPEPTDLREEVTRLAETLARKLPDAYRLGQKVSGTGPLVAHVDRHALVEVVGQLVGNAQDSMPSGGEIELRVDTRELDEAFCARHPWARQGRFASVGVLDHGSGMDEETRAGLFDLMSGDKMEGGVSGLGLAMTYGFIKQHAGYVLVESTPQKGSLVELLFPIAAERAPAGGVEEKGAAADGRGEARTVLYVEDNARLRRAARRILESAGFVVKEAEDGRQALSVLDSSDPVDLVLSDLIMPDIGGATLYRMVQEMEEPPRFLFTTGHADAIASGDEQVPGHVPYLLKPWSREQLLSAIEDALGD